MTIELARGFLASPRLIDLILAFTLVEAMILTLWHRRTRRGLPPIGVVSLLLPGIFLLLGLRAALADAAWPWLPAALAAALTAHLLDLRDRWRR